MNDCEEQRYVFELARPGPCINGIYVRWKNYIRPFKVFAQLSKLESSHHLIKQAPRVLSLPQTISNGISIIHTYFELLRIKMKTSYANTILAFVASVSAAPALQARTYPTVATYEVTLGEVDPAYLAQLESAVVNLDEGAATKRDNEARQTGTCDLQG